MFKSLEGKVAIVTGSSSGIGEGVALKLAAAGAKVTICGRSVQRTRDVEQRCIQASGGRADHFLSLFGDLTDRSYRNAIVDKTAEKFGKVDILVANAGIPEMGGISSCTEEQYDLVMGTNLKSVYFLIQRCLPHLEKSRGNIVCVSSMGSHFPFPGGEVYQMSKAGMDTLVRTLAFSLASKGIRVNGTNPGPVHTRVLRALGPEQEPVTAPLTKYTVQGRPSTVEEQADVILFLAAETAAAITGQCVTVDGGMSLGNTALIDVLAEVQEKMKRAAEQQAKSKL